MAKQKSGTEKFIVNTFAIFCCLFSLLVSLAVIVYKVSKENTIIFYGNSTMMAPKTSKPQLALSSKYITRVTSSYSVVIPNATISSGAESVYSPTLIASLDILAPQIMREVNTAASHRTFKISAATKTNSTVNLPTEIIEWSEGGEFVCRYHL